MAYFFKYQWAEISDPHYSFLRKKAFPIVRYEISTDGQILKVQLKLSDSVFEWFSREQLIMYRGSDKYLEAAKLSKTSSGFFGTLLQKLNMKRF